MFKSAIARYFVLTALAALTLGLPSTQHLPRVRALTCLTPPSGIVSWWPGDGNASDIEGGNHGASNNGATFAAGKVGQAFRFDGVDDYFNFATLPVTNYFSSQWTIEFWANPGAVADRPTFGFASSGTANTDNPVASYDDFLTFGDGAGGFQLLTALPNAPANTWTHYALVDNGATYAVYVNGAFQYSAAITTNPASAANRSFLLGQSGFSGIYADYFAGRLDEFTIYDRALSGAEIEALYYANGGGKCKGGASADLSISKTDGRTSALPGETVIYTINVVNNSPNALTGVLVTDNFPAALTGVTWTCAAAPGSHCGITNGSGNINRMVNLGAFGYLTFTATGTVSGSATGVISNTATVTPPGSISDPETTNNSATDTTVVGTSLADLTMTKSAPASTFRNATLTYTWSLDKKIGSHGLAL